MLMEVNKTFDKVFDQLNISNLELLLLLPMNEYHEDDDGDNEVLRVTIASTEEHNKMMNKEK